MKNLDCKGAKSTTLWLIIFTAVGATALLVNGYIADTIWETVIMASVITYAFKEVGSKAAEAHRDKAPPPGADTPPE